MGLQIASTIKVFEFLNDILAFKNVVIVCTILGSKNARSTLETVIGKG